MRGGTFALDVLHPQTHRSLEVGRALVLHTDTTAARSALLRSLNGGLVRSGGRGGGDYDGSERDITKGHSLSTQQAV